MSELQAIYTADLQAAGDNPAVVYVSSLSTGSRRTMRNALDTVAQLVTGDETAAAEAIPWHELRYKHMTAIKAALAERYAPATANKILSALRGTLKASWRMGQMSAEDYHAAVDIGSVEGNTIPAGRAIPSGELTALLETCGTDDTGVRDAAIIAVLYACGLRRAELVALDLADYDEEAGELHVRGKRNKQRIMYVDVAALHLGDWLQVRGREDGPLFVGTGNNNRGGRLSTQAIYVMLHRRAAAAGIASLSPHDFRRSFISDLLDRGADIATVRDLAGHESVETTANYDRRGERAKRKAAGLLHVPYKPRVTAAEGQKAS